ncbi:ubiquitin carboxyl-terminal hydrolase 2-like isoform X2 [Ostrea edulis]|uniref:ubiquitin carboxyl-terminal hydrolase 2-like isoform X2 n=1 Tax=Ostrea edulis TaxID=37623 RepID=UPI0024AE9D31|nr:ubiquitin carboxyl-terminal hydrolase 2-like isoform X2 [Ostrea edulis]
MFCLAALGNPYNHRSRKSSSVVFTGKTKCQINESASFLVDVVSSVDEKITRRPNKGDKEKTQTDHSDTNAEYGNDHDRCSIETDKTMDGKRVTRHQHDIANHGSLPKMDTLQPSRTIYRRSSPQEISDNTDNNKMKSNECTAPKGLENPSQICYRNCILQILAQTTDFFEQLNMKTKTSAGNANAGLTKHLYTLLDNIRSGKGSGEIAKTNAVQFHKFLDKKIQRFRPSEQDDSHSFFICILCAIEKECNDSDTPSDIFKLQLQSSLQCSIQQDKIEYIEERPMFSIPAPKKDDIQESLLIFFGEEHLRDFKCECCDESNASYTIKRLRMMKIPNVVVLHLEKPRERSNTFRKTRKVLKFKEDMGAFYPSEKCTNNILHLYGIVVHRGGLSGGHYFSYVKSSGSEQWYKCNDMNVQKVMEDEVLKEDPYLLFYSK